MRILTANATKWAALSCVALATWVHPPVRADEVTDIVITEVMYNPASGDRNEDFIELYNAGSVAHDLQGWTFTSGVDFTFPSVVIPAGGYLVVCANQNRIRQLYGITNTVGDWNPATTLDNGGERIRLVNAADVEVEDFTYDDRNPWPILADGYGHSLERRNPLYDNDDPANWSASEVGSGWTRVTVSSIATSSRLYLYLTEAGTAYVDDLRLYPLDNPGGDRIQNGGFETGLSPWVATGTHSGSISSTERARTGTRGLKIVATGAGSSQPNSVYQEGLGLTNGDQYTLEFFVYLTAPGQTLVARLSGSDQDGEFYIQTGGGGATPGRQNSVYATDIPPFVFPATHVPSTPTSTSQVSLVAQAKDDVSVAQVIAHWDSGSGEQTAPMFDDGAHSDGVAGDGLYGVGIGSFATGKIVRYWFTALDGSGQEGRFPFAGNPTPTMGFYIQPPGIEPDFLAISNSGLISNLPPVYHLIIDPSQLTGNPPSLSGDVTAYRRATFIFNGEVFDNIRVRHRGQTSLGVPKKHWKFDFNKDHRFRTPFADHPEVDNINLQSGYGDKSFLREWLSYKSWMDLGLPGLEMWHVRFYINGTYRGLYIHLENPNTDWMDRTGLDAEGWLWKSYSDAKGGTGGFELKADGGNASAANSALGTFISNMNSLTGQALVDYINANVDVPKFIDFLAIHQLIQNCDHPAKNYLVYADEDAPAGTWTFLGWDMDLTWGRNFECSGTTTGQPGITYGNGTGVYNDTIRYDMFGDPNLLFGTSARPKCDGPWNGVINAFLNKTTAFRSRYYARVAELLVNNYDPEVLDPLIEDMAAPLESEVTQNWDLNAPYGLRSTYAFHVGMLKSFVRDRYDYLASKLSSLDAPDIDGLICQRSGDNAVLSWTNHGIYDSIKVYRNGALQRTLSGTTRTVTVALDLGTTVNSYRVASVLGSIERPGQSCSIIISGGGFVTVLDESFTAPPANFRANCSASVVDGLLELTPASDNLAGSAFFTQAFPLDRFVAEFDMRFDDPSSPGADGMTFIMNTGDDTATCGAAGGALGYLSGDGGVPVFPGFAVVFDTWQNPGEPSDNWAGFVDAAAGGTPRVSTDLTQYEFTGTGTFHATVIGREGTFTLLLSNPAVGLAETEIFTYTVPGFTAGIDAHFGFSAGTGGAVTRHVVDNFVLQIDTGQTEPVVAAFSADVQSGPAPLAVSFTNKSTGASTYLWDFGDGQTSTDRNPSHTYTLAGTYSVTLTARADDGEEDTLVENAYISVVQSTKAAFVASPVLGQAPLQVTFTNQSTGSTSYEWDFGDGQTSTQRSPVHTYSAGGQYTVTLVARGTGGLEDTLTRTNLVQVDGPLDASFFATPTSGSAPLAVNFTDTSVAIEITTWLWDFGDGATSGEPHPAHTYTKDGIYTVTLQIFGFSATDQAVRDAYIRVGSGGGAFIRGDANGDAHVDISDPIAILNYLFLGGTALDCLDAADSDDTGAVDITDAIRILSHLFQGGTAPEPPYPGPGADPTPDDLPACNR